MKKYLLLFYLSLFFLFPKTQFAQWEKIFEVEDYYYPLSHCMDFQNEDTGFICITSGPFGFEILKTTNGGELWNIVLEEESNVYSPVDFHFINNTVGYLMSADRALWKTIDGGDNWTLHSYNYVPNDVSTVYFINESIGFVDYAKTIDGGQSWENMILANFSEYQFITDMIGLAVGENGIYRTIDQGDNWVKVDPLSYIDFISISMIDENIGFASNNQKELFRTTDAGLTWNLWHTEPYFLFDKIQFINETIGFAGASYGFLSSRVWKTLDGGNNWIPIIPLSRDLTDFNFITETTGYVLDYRTALYKTTNGGGDGILPKPGNPDWVNVISSNSGVSISSSIYDSEENIYAAGYFKDSILLNGKYLLPGGIPPSNEYQSFILKMTNQGELEWFKNDDHDGCYDFNLFIGPDDQPVIIAPCSEYTALSKYNKMGELLWQKIMTGYVFTVDMAFDMDDAGNIYVSGNTSHSISYEGLTLNVTGGIYFLLKTDNNGVPIFLEELLSRAQSTYPLIKVDHDNNIYCCVHEGDTLFVGQDTIVPNFTESYLIKFNESLDYLWNTWVHFDEYNIVSNALEVDMNNNVIVNGISNISSNSHVGYIQNYNPDGQSKYSKTLKRITGFYSHLTSNSQNQLIATGNINNYLDIDGDGMITYGDPELQNSMGDIYVIKLNQNGDYDWMFQIWNSYGSYALDNYQDVYVIAGNFVNELHFEENLITSPFPRNGFIAQFIDPTSSIENQSQSLDKIDIFPNPTSGYINIKLSSKSFKSAVIEIYSITGQKVYETSILGHLNTLDLSKLNKGIYFVQLSMDRRIYTEKIIVQ